MASDENFDFMSPNRRILLNIIATYGRSLYSLLCGLFSARWVLLALGKVDYGLFGVVGALTVFISFLNMMLSSSLGRFYALSIGEDQENKTGDRTEGFEKCQAWFNVALSIHTAIPVGLMCLGYPIGVWLVENVLTIPANRMDACVWVFRLACVSSFFSMVNVPFRAMYIAKQYIAELTVYSIAQTTANTIFFYFMASHPGTWLLKYAVWMCLVTITPQILICLRAFRVFPECRINWSMWWNIERIREIGGYTIWQMFGGLGALLRNQGVAILINKYFGPAINASMSIANQVNAQCGTLSNSMLGAFIPAITTAYGSRDIVRVRQMSYRVCKFGLLLLLVFMIPLVLEIKEVMHLWLKNPPEYSSGLCLCMMSMLLIDKSTIGHMVAVNATGKIASYQMVLGGTLIVSFFLGWLFIWLGWGLYSMCAALIIMTIVMALGRLFFARRLVGLEIRIWAFQVAMPTAIITILVSIIAYIPQLFYQASFTRVMLTSIVSWLSFFPLCWFLALNSDERHFLVRRIQRLIP